MPHSFFSSFSSNISTTSTWKPILNSLQENQRLNRLIQVRETRLQELSYNNPIPSHSRLSSGPFLDDLPSSDQDRLTEILHISQRNLKILSIKVGSLPQNLVKALDLVLEDPSPMSTSQKFDCLSAIELLQEKLCDLVLNSEEILSFFKDIALECEASASNCKTLQEGQEGLLAFADQREEIFLSKDLNRVKIQNLHRLVMSLESWKRRKGIFVEELDSNSRVQYDECIRETLDRLGQKEQEVAGIRNHYKASLQQVMEKVNSLKAGLKRMRHCVEFELFSTWSCLIGQENSIEPSCHQVIRKIAEFQQGAKMKNLQVAVKFERVKKDVGINKNYWAQVMADVNELVLKSSQGIMSKIKQQQKFLQLVAGQLKQEQEDKAKVDDELKNCLKTKQGLEKELQQAEGIVKGLKAGRVGMKEKWNLELGKLKKRLEDLEKEREGLREIVVGRDKKCVEGMEKVAKVLRVLPLWARLGQEFRLVRDGVKVVVDSETCRIKESVRSGVFDLLFIILQLILKEKKQIELDKSEIIILIQNYNQSLAEASGQLGKTCGSWSGLLQSAEKDKKDLEILLESLQDQISTLHLENDSLYTTLKVTEEKLKTTEENLKTTEKTLKTTEENLKTTEKTLKTTEKTLKTTEENLKTTQTALKETEKTLETTESTLKATEATLSKQIQLSNSSQSSLCQANKDLESELNSFKLKHEALNLEHSQIKSDLEQKTSKLSSLNEKYRQSSSDLEKLQSESKSLKQDLDQMEKLTEIQSQQINSLSDQLSSTYSCISDLENESKSLHHSLNEAKSNLNSKSLQVSSLESTLSSLNTSYELLLKTNTIQNSKLQRLKPLISTLQSLQQLNQSTLRDLGDLKSSHLQDLKTLQAHLLTSTSTNQVQGSSLLALELAKNSLEQQNNDLQSQVFRLQESSSKYLQELNSIKTKNSQKFLKVKRKIKTFALVLAHERTLIKDLHQDWMRYMRNSLESLRVVVESIQDFRTTEEKKVKFRIEKVFKETDEQVRVLQAEMRKMQDLIGKKEKELEEKEEIIGKIDGQVVGFERKIEEKDLALQKVAEEIAGCRRVIEGLMKEKEELGLKVACCDERVLALEQENSALAQGLGKGLVEEEGIIDEEEIFRLEKEIDRLAKGNSELIEQVNSELETKHELESKIKILEQNEFELKISMEEVQMQQTKLANTNHLLSQNIKRLEEEKLSYESKISSLEESLNQLETLKQSQQLELGFLISGKKFTDKSFHEVNILLKEKLEKTLKTLTSFRELNNILRSQVIKFLSSSSFDFEAFRIKLFEHVRLDIVKIKSNLEILKGKYTEERNILHIKIDAMKNSIDSNQDLVIPVKDFIKENQESIDSLNDTFEKTSQTYQQNIEENIKKVDDLQSKIESYRIKGYELLNKYKRDSVLYEPEDYDSDFQEPLDQDRLARPNLPSKPEKSLKSDTLSIDFNDLNRDASYSSFILEVEPSSLMPNNELLNKADSKTKSSWRLPHLIKTLERYLNNKYRDDINALEKNREPLTMQEYLYQSLCNESKPLADKKLKELLNTFKENQHDRRIKFYCRLFQVYEPNPINYKLSLYIIQMRNEFNKFVSKQVIPEAHTKRVDKMQVLNLLGVARKLFGSDLETGKVVLKYLKPENMLSTVWTITCLEYFLYKNMVPAECFWQITKQETMTEQEFVTGLSRMDTFVSEDDLQELFNSQFTGFISIDEFTRLFDLDSFFKRNQIYMVDQLHFLNSLIEGYNSMRIRHFKEVENLILSKCGKKLILTYEEANLVLNELGSSAEQVFPKTPEISARDLKKKIFEMNIGSKGIGCYNLKAIKKISDTFEEKGL